MSTSHSPAMRSLPRAILGSLLTPAGLFCGLVALLIATCPGARGDGARDDGAWLSSNSIQPAVRVPGVGGSHAWGDAVVDVGPAVSMAAFDKPLADDRGPTVRFARSAAPDERGGGPAAPTDALGHSKAALPLLVDPLLASGAGRPQMAPRPLTGPAVGVTSRPRQAASVAPTRQTPFASLRGSSGR